MANVNRPFGFITSDSEGKQLRIRPYIKKTGSAIYPGDVVKRASTGNVEVATAGDQMLGVAAEYKAATSTDSILVCDDPEAVFETMALGDFQLADIFQNANIDATSGDTTVLRSKQSIAMSTKGTDLGLQFQLIGLINDQVNAVGSFARILAKPNNHAFKQGVSGV